MKFENGVWTYEWSSQKYETTNTKKNSFEMWSGTWPAIQFTFCLFAVRGEKDASIKYWIPFISIPQV